MALVLTCPTCQARCQVEERLRGAKVRCPTCAAVIAVPRPVEEDIPEVLPCDGPPAAPVSPTPRAAVPRPPRERAEDDRPRRLARDREPPPLRKSRVGLIVGLVLAGVLLLCGLPTGLLVIGYVSFQRQLGMEQRAARTPMAAERAVLERPAVAPGEAKGWGPAPVPLIDREAQRRAEEARLKEEAQRQEESRKAMERQMEELRRREEEDQRQREDRARADREARRRKPLADVTIPAAQPGQGSLAGPQTSQGGLTWCRLPIDVSANPPARPGGPAAVASVAWAADGASFYTLTRGGLLSQVRYPALTEQRRVNLGQECSGLAFCKLGLMLTLPQLQEIWVIHPDTFAVVKRVGVSELQKALTGPGLTVAYAFCRTTQFADPGAPVRVNLEDGTLAEMRPERSDASRRFMAMDGFGYPALAPNGRWLFTDGGHLLRYSLDGLKLTLDATSHTGMGNGHKEGVCVSPDSRWVCFPTGGGNDGLNYATYVYRTEDLSRPAFTLHQGAYPEIVGFDPAGKRIFSQNYDHALLVFDENGTKRSEHKFPGVSGSHNIKQYAARPTDGRALLLRTNDALLLIEFADGRPTGN